ncbi:hypothetical protein GCM10020000_00040 [Streptomyces olivoverticillatus]
MFMRRKTLRQPCPGREIGAGWQRDFIRSMMPICRRPGLRAVGVGRERQSAALGASFQSPAWLSGINETTSQGTDACDDCGTGSRHHVHTSADPSIGPTNLWFDEPSDA